MIKLYNTLSRKVEKITHGQVNPVRLYTCGPTVYDFAHIGNFRSYIFADSIRRALEFSGAKVGWVMNLTDVDDKTIKRTIKAFGNKATAQDLYAYTSKFINIFYQELQEINIQKDTINFYRVADQIPEIQKFICELLDKGYAYQNEDGVFFSIEKYQKNFADYGELVGQSFLSGKKIGARVAVDEYEKENLSDFALWKTRVEEDAQIFWDHPKLGRGRPGWHIECSAINHSAFGGTTDIHTGGVDLIFPHHTNEIAQSQPVYKPFVRHWAHNEHLLVNGKKMAKRDGNFYLLKDLKEKHPLNILAFRYLCLQTDFRKPMNFTWESLEAARNALEKLYAKARSISSKSEIRNQKSEMALPFTDAITNDLNLPGALASTWEVVNNNILSPNDKYALLLEFDKVLGLNLANPPDEESRALTPEIKELLNKRERARKIRDFKTADELRKEIEQMGYNITDKAVQ